MTFTSAVHPFVIPKIKSNDDHQVKQKSFDTLALPVKNRMVTDDEFERLQKTHAALRHKFLKLAINLQFKVDEATEKLVKHDSDEYLEILIQRLLDYKPRTDLQLETLKQQAQTEHDLRIKTEYNLINAEARIRTLENEVAKSNENFAMKSQEHLAQIRQQAELIEKLKAETKYSQNQIAGYSKMKSFYDDVQKLVFSVGWDVVEMDLMNTTEVNKESTEIVDVGSKCDRDVRTASGFHANEERDFTNQFRNLPVQTFGKNPTMVFPNDPQFSPVPIEIQNPRPFRPMVLPPRNQRGRFVPYKPNFRGRNVNFPRPNAKYN